MHSQQVPVLEMAFVICSPASSLSASASTLFFTYSIPVTGPLPWCSLNVPCMLSPQSFTRCSLGLKLACLTPYFLQMFAQRSPYQRAIPDHVFQLSVAAYQTTPKHSDFKRHFYYSSQFCGWGIWAGLGWKNLLKLILTEVIQGYLVGEWAWREASFTCLALWQGWWKAGLN